MARSRRPADRAALRECPVPNLGALTPQSITITISAWQPMTVYHRAFYDHGACLLELDEDERPVRAYQRYAPVC